MPAKHCMTCGSESEVKRSTKGAWLTEVLLWLCFLLPGLIYSVWRLYSRQDVCSECEAEHVRSMLHQHTASSRAAENMHGN